ncbi:molybdate ABC transporter substrate-binding protein [Arthrobacter sp. 35W]|uniref:molybdate ABC transporter substrate-binding protein n=1 Tax=Arthrobacter sp. 35W TaxID=1132441 RepID=UPI0004163AF8|nr:molybdate ABC transporter substrate-binding protein [Arthrobacter sp. 35W]
MITKTTTLLATAVLAAGALAGCGAGTPSAGSTTTAAASTSASTPALSGTLTVFAAASLKATFTELAKEFEAQHPGTKIQLSFAGSSDLVTQITAGAPADVFASADTKNMAKLADASLLDGAAVNFASNRLTIAVPPSNPANIAGLSDLARDGVKVVVCAPQVPCGAAAVTAEKAAGVSITPVSEESSVTDVLGKVVSGEADAGLVYVTDVKGAAGKVTGIPFDAADKAVTTYPIATVAASKNKELAAAFTALVSGDAGRKVLSDAGFGAP